MKDNPIISIVFQHIKSQYNDECLSLVTRCFAENTVNPYELIAIDEEGNQFELFNKYIDKCKSDIVVFSNIDCIPCKNWDEPYVKNYDKNTILTQYLIEPGALLAPDNYQKSFGLCPLCFQREKFEEYASKIMSRYTGWRADGGSTIPCCISKSLFIEHGKLSTTFSRTPIDLQLFDKMRKLGIKIKRSESCWYRFNQTAQKIKCACSEACVLK